MQQIAEYKLNVKMEDAMFKKPAPPK
jgi:hypothetical protein